MTLFGARGLVPADRLFGARGSADRRSVCVPGERLCNDGRRHGQRFSLVTERLFYDM